MVIYLSATLPSRYSGSCTSWQLRQAAVFWAWGINPKHQSICLIATLQRAGFTTTHCHQYGSRLRRHFSPLIPHLFQGKFKSTVTTSERMRLVA